MSNIRRSCGLAGVLPVVVLLLSGCAHTTPPDAAKIMTVPAGPASPVDPAPDSYALAHAEVVTADKLYTVYSQNLIEGANPDQRYRERLLLLSGSFAGINRGLPGRTYVELATHDPDAFVYAELTPEAQPLLATLTPGQSLRLTCVGAGMMAGSPRVRSCRPA